MTRLSLRLAGLVSGLLLATGGLSPAAAEVPVQAYEVVRAYPHDKTAFTEGLFFHDGALYESTGLYPSFIRQVQLETGEVVRQRDLPTVYFGEGMTTLNDSLVSLVAKKIIDPGEAYAKSVNRLEFKNLLQRQGIEVKGAI